MCPNTTMWVYGAQIKWYRVLCSKHIAARSSLVITSCWFTTSRLRVPASVRRVYWFSTGDRVGLTGTAGDLCPPACLLNTLRPRQNGRHFSDNIFKCIFLNENFRISNKISLIYVPWGLIDNMTTLVCWYILLTHTCVTQPLWVNSTYVFSWEKKFQSWFE